MRRVAKSVRSLAHSFWQGLREWCGDAAYESYLRSKNRDANCCSKLSRAEFYVEQLNRRYSRPNRCC
ncbi:MAG TPA: CstA-like transporter-associated (seleno)protein [Candidatus Acidoferrum sp.]|nr:CstA-like transporter-associated (seleno)protein [Candidatus Acidoferrum sp.]